MEMWRMVVGDVRMAVVVDDDYVWLWVGGRRHLFLRRIPNLSCRPTRRGSLGFDSWGMFGSGWWTATVDALLGRSGACFFTVVRTLAGILAFAGGASWH